MQAGHGLPTLIARRWSVFVLVCEHLMPLVIVRRDPERVLELLLPSFEAVARLLRPLTARCCVSRRPSRRGGGRPRPTARR